MDKDGTRVAVQYDSTAYFEINGELMALVTGGLPGCGAGPPPADTVCVGNVVCSVNTACPEECHDLNLGCPTGQPTDLVCGDPDGNLNVVC